MTKEEGELYITLAVLHGPSTTGDVDKGERGSHDPLHVSRDGTWWVFRSKICSSDFATRAEAAKHYCASYNIKP